MKTKTNPGKRSGILFCIAIMAACLSAGCRSSPETAKVDELDLAIREATDYLNDNIPAGSLIVILNVESDSPMLSEYIIDELIANAVNDRIFNIADRQQLDLIRAEQNFQLSGEVDDNLAQRVGSFLGAQLIVSGRINKAGDMFRLTMRALDVLTAKVQGQYNRNIQASSTIIALMDSKETDRTAYSESGKSSAGVVSNDRTQSAPADTNGSSQPLTAMQQLRSGTYTLMPRPRGRLGGVWQDIYISRVEVDSEYMTFYFEDREIAGSYYGRSATVFWDRDHATLTDLDKPTIYKRNTGRSGQDGGYLVSCVFPRIDSRRLKLENRQGIIFAEIVLGEVD